MKDSKEELLQIIDAWAQAKRLEDFFADAERRARDLTDDQRERTIERFGLAHALIGSSDALERFDAWGAPEERSNNLYFRQLINRIDLGVSVGGIIGISLFEPLVYRAM